jgi:predicted transposase YdaD
MESATKTGLGAIFQNTRDCVPLRLALEEMGHPQAVTPIQTDNACATGITNQTVKQRRSRAIDMRFYWIRDRIKQGQFVIHWRAGKDNLTAYFTKYHSPAHHKLMRSQYLLELHKPAPT